MVRQALLLSIAFVASIQGCADDEPAESTGGSSGTSTGGKASSGAGGKGGAAAAGSGGELGGAAGDLGEGGGPIGQGGFGGEPTDCVREYDLESYTGSIEGLCPAAEVTHCDCDEGAAVKVICAPDESICVVQGGECEPEVDCGWHECPSPPPDEFCERMQTEVEAAPAGSPRRCVRDVDCQAPELCALRIYNMMFCADPADLGGGGEGGSGGHGGAAGQGGAGGGP